MGALTILYLLYYHSMHLEFYLVHNEFIQLVRDFHFVHEFHLVQIEFI